MRAWALGTPLDLAVMRITVGALFLYVQDLHGAARAAARLPDALRTLPSGVATILGVLGPTPLRADIAYAIVMVAAITGTLGLFSRASFAVVSIVSLWLWALPQTSGAVFHYHHLLWLAALLSVSPCGDALSIDAWRSRRAGKAPPPERDLRYGAPVRVAWMLLACVYFFPGVWKLRTSGVAWFWSDNLRDQMWAKWIESPSYVPLARIDRYPTIVRIGALLVLALELTFPVLVLFRRTRPIAVLGAFAFHQSTALFMALYFSALWLCAPIFFAWEPVRARIAGWLGRGGTAEPGARRGVRGGVAIAAMSALLLGGAVTTGVLGESESWPFACYPKFDALAPQTLPFIELELVDVRGDAHVVPRSEMFPRGLTQRTWALVWSLVGVRGHDVSHERLAAFWDVTRQRPSIRARAANAVEVRFYRLRLSTNPDTRDAPPVSRTLIYTMPLRRGP